MIIINTYESSFEAFFDYNDCQFCLKTVLLLTKQLILCLKFLHFKFIMHCNLSLKMLTLSRTSWQNQQMFLINFDVIQKYTKLDFSASCDLEVLNQILIYFCDSKCL